MPFVFRGGLFQVCAKASRNPQAYPGLLRLAIKNHFLKLPHGFCGHERDAAIIKTLMRHTFLQELPHLGRRQRRLSASILEGHVHGQPVITGGLDGNFRRNNFALGQQRLESIPDHHLPLITPTGEDIGKEVPHHGFRSQHIHKARFNDSLLGGALRCHVARPIPQGILRVWQPVTRRSAGQREYVARIHCLQFYAQGSQRAVHRGANTWRRHRKFQLLEGRVADRVRLLLQRRQFLLVKPWQFRTRNDSICHALPNALQRRTIKPPRAKHLAGAARNRCAVQLQVAIRLKIKEDLRSFVSRSHGK